MHTSNIIVSGKIQLKFILKLYIYTTFCINITEIALLTMYSGGKKKVFRKLSAKM